MEQPELFELSQLNEARTEKSHDDWQTPEHILERVRRVFGDQIDLDPFSSSENPTKARLWFSSQDDAYEQPWHLGFRSTFINPPYGSGLRRFARKVVQELDETDPAGLVTLTPCRPDTEWYDILVSKADAVAEVRGRLKFRGFSPKHGKLIDNVPAQFPSVLMYFGPRPAAFCDVFADIARCRVT